MGIEISAVGLPRKPWHLEDEIPLYELKSNRRRNQLDEAASVDDSDAEWTLLKSVRRLIPPDLYAPGLVRWSATPHQRLTEPSIEIHERYVTERQTLFGDHSVARSLGRCRLCGEQGLAFSTPACVNALCYCQGCLIRATRGAAEDRPRAAAALGLIGNLEFDQSPMLESQLDHLHINPAQPVSGELIDTLLLLRFAIRRKLFPWTYLLEEAGLAPDGGLRLSRGTLLRARDGHRCLSMGEQTICDFLHMHHIAHEREPFYPSDPELNPKGLRRADWVLTDGTFVELWGLPNDPAYAVRMELKRQLAKRCGLPLLELTSADLPHLPQRFAKWLPGDVGTTTKWSWTPRVSTRAAERRSPGAKRGENARNRAARAERLARCKQSVDAQKEGLTRSQIAQRLNVGTDTVKMLLHDGKFLADPESDPERLLWAKAATEAKSRGITEEEFRTTNTLTRRKSNEAWKDSALLELTSTDAVEAEVPDPPSPGTSI